MLNDDNFASAISECLAADRMVVVVLLVLVRCQAGTPVSPETCRMPFPNILTLTRTFPADTSNVVDMSAMFESASCLTKTLACGSHRK